MRRPALLLVPVLLLAACSSGSPKPVPSSLPGLVTQAKDPSHQHVTTHVTYAQTPPVGGPHWYPNAYGATGWLACGVYDVPLPNEFAVHSEEHGAVWLTYRPGASAADVAALVALVKLHTDYVLVSPYPGQPQQFAASTWGAQLGVDNATDPRLAQFVKTYAGGGQGGEQGADCAHGSTPAQARAAQARADAAAGRSASPSMPPANA